MIKLSNGFRTFHTINMGSVGQRAAKLLAVNVKGLKKKVYHPALALLEPVDPGLIPGEVKLFSKFDYW